MLDLLSWASHVHDSLLPYDHFRSGAVSPDRASCQSKEECAPKRFLNFQTGSHLPVRADRIKWKYPPTFDASPYLEPLLRKAFEEPELLRRPVGDWPKLPPARVHCTKAELLRPAEKCDLLGSVVIRPAHEIAWGEAVGLFCVAKSATHDRFIVNPVVSNSRSFTISRFSKTLAPGSLLTLLSLEPGVGFRFSADDLSDYYYS